MPLAGGAAVPVTRNGGYVAFESMDGRYLYYTQTATGPSSLWRIPTAGGGEPERVLEGVSERAFVVLQQGIYFVKRQTQRRTPVPVGMAARAGSDAPGQLNFFDFARSQSRVIADLATESRSASACRLTAEGFSSREWTIRPATS